MRRANPVQMQILVRQMIRFDVIFLINRICPHSPSLCNLLRSGVSRPAMAGTVFLVLAAAARLDSAAVTAYFRNLSVICKADTNRRARACGSISCEIDMEIRIEVNFDQRLLGKSSSSVS